MKWQVPVNLLLDPTLTEGYHGKTQIARVMTEDWVGRQLFCPRCGCNHVEHLPNNSPVGDFACPACDSQFELKSKSGQLGERINDGAYGTFIERITSNENPDFLFMGYSAKSLSVQNLVIVPKHFFVPAIVEKRKPLGPTARRAGWVGCVISLAGIPQQGRIPVVRNGEPIDKNAVLERVRLADRLAVDRIDARGWLMDVLNCVNRIPGEEFTLADMYAFENVLSEFHPDNNNVRPKIRQQLQFLRDRGVLEFLGNGRYRKLGMH